MNVSIEISESSDWNSLLGKKVLKLIPSDKESAFKLGSLLEKLYGIEKVCSCTTGECSIIVPLVPRNDLNLPIIKKVDPDEPPF